MSKPKVLVATSIATESLPSRFAIRALEWLANYAGGVEDQSVELLYPALLFRESYLPMARQKLLAQFLGSKAEYLLMLDADETWPLNGVSTLALRELPVVSGLYFATLPPHLPVWRRWNPDTRQLEVPLAPAPNGPFRVDAVGAGFLCIRRDVAEAVGEHAFMPDLSLAWGSVSEDFAFCYKALAAGFQVWVDPTVRIGHLTMQSVGEGTFLSYLHQNRQTA